MKVLAFDQSTTRSGHAIFIDGRYDHSGVIDLHNDKNTARRFRMMYEAIYKLILEEKPDFIVFENTQMQAGNGAAFKMLCQLQGTIIGMCFTMNIPFQISEPSHWRGLLKFKQGPKVKRDELKAQSKAYAKEHFGIVDSEDRAEAACIGAAYCIENFVKDDIDID